MKKLVCILVTLSACAAPPPEPATQGIDLATARLVDLSYTYDDDTLYWPTSPSSFELEELAYGDEAGYFYSSYAFCTPEHGGTHFDAPIHFAAGGLTTAEVPVRQLIAPGVVIDMSEAASADPDARLDVARDRLTRHRDPVLHRVAVELREALGKQRLQLVVAWHV